MRILDPYSSDAANFSLGIYEHVKGNRYRVISVGRLEATLEEVVVYHSLQDAKECWVRPLGEFLTRFKKIDE